MLGQPVRLCLTEGQVRVGMVGSAISAMEATTRRAAVSAIACVRKSVV